MNNSHERSLAIIILAAGSSSRLGQSKQLVTFHNKSLLELSIDAALGSSVNDVHVILGAHAQIHQQAISNRPVQIHNHAEWSKGIGSSLKFGIEKLKDSLGAMILVCDQPLVSSSHLKKLISHFQADKKNIVASSYGKTFGVPALFHKDCFEEIMQLNDEEGAKKVIQRNLNLTTLIDFPDGEFDIDLPEDLLNLRRKDI